MVRGDEEGEGERRAAMEEKASSPLIPPPSEIDLEAGGGGEQLQCRICLETDGEGREAPWPRPGSRGPLLRWLPLISLAGRDGRAAEI